jgi:hypothetical protein
MAESTRRGNRRLLAGARRRYHALRPVDRPPLHQPENAVGLFTLPELLALAKRGYWPLPADALHWIAESPEERQRRRRRIARPLAEFVRTILAAELPAAVAYLQGRPLV